MKAEPTRLTDALEVGGREKSMPRFWSKQLDHLRCCDQGGRLGKGRFGRKRRPGFCSDTEVGPRF